MPLKFTAVDEFCQNILVKSGYAAGIKTQLIFKLAGECAGQQQVCNTKGGSYGTGEGIQIKHIVVVRQGKHGLLRLGRGREFRFIVILHDPGSVAVGPVDVFPALAGTGGNAAGKTAVGGNVQNPGPAGIQSLTADAVTAQRQAFRLSTVGTVYHFNFVVGRVFNGVTCAPSEQLHDQSVQVFGTGTDDNAFRLYPDAAASGKVTADGILQLGQAGARYALKQVFALLSDHAAHDLGIDGEGKIRAFYGNSYGLAHHGSRGKQVPLPEGHKVAAAFPCFQKAFLLQQFQAVLGGDQAHVPALCDDPLGQEALTVAVYAIGNVTPQLFVQLHVYRFARSK